MEALQVIAGFNDIKLQFSEKINNTNRLSELYLWFSQNESFLTLHDYDNNDACIILAAFNSTDKKIYWVNLQPESLGFKLLYFLENNYYKHKIYSSFSETLNVNFKLYGCFLPRRL
jgi:hypothetical protein